MKELKGKILLYIFLFSLSLRFIFWVFFYNHPERAFDPDSFGYNQLAENLLDSYTFPSIGRTPVYPFFIAVIYSIFGKFPQAVLIPQYFLDSLTALFVVLMFFRISGNTRYSYSAGLIYAINPFAIFYSNMILTETLFTFIFVTAMYFFIIFLQNQQKRYLIVSSFLLGIGTLCRPISLYLPLLLAPFIFTTGYRFRYKCVNVFIILIAYCMILIPWYMRNYHEYDTWNVSTVSDVNIFYYEAPAILMIKDNPFSMVQFKITKSIDDLNMGRWKKVKEKYGWNEESAFELADDPQRLIILRKEGLTVIRENPLIFLLSHLGGIGRILFPFYPYFDKFLGSDSIIIKVLSFCIDLIIMGLSFIGLISLLKKKETLLSNRLQRIIIVIMLVLIFYFTFLPGIIGYNRFKIPVLPYITIFATLGLWRILQLFNQRGDLVKEHL